MESTHYYRIADGLLSFAGSSDCRPAPFQDCYPNKAEADSSPFRVGELLPWKKMWLKVEDVGRNWLKLGVMGVTRRVS